MNCFQLVKTVLDEIYNEIASEYGEDTDRAIKEKLAYLGENYKEIDGGVKIDYSDPVSRFAYIYRYTTAHANIVYQFIRDSERLREVFDTSMVNVSCIGGGPGSDLLGILKFMSIENTSTKLKKLMCFLCDKEITWREAWCDIGSKIDTPSACSIYTVPWELDVTEPDTLTSYNKIFNADLFTMIYFVSEIYAFREDARDFFEYCFDKAKTGALFLFVDNSSYKFYNWFDGLAQQNGLEIVKKQNYYTFQTEGDEEKEDLGCYYDKFQYPKLQAEIAYRIYRKVEEKEPEDLVLDWQDKS